jgi:phospholipid-binding lipoprotein MlaA
VWGVAPGPYLVLPVFGPSTVRDAAGLPLDLAASPYYAINDGAFRPVTTVLGALNARSQLMSATQALDAIAMDKYSFVRDAFLSRRRLVYGNNPPDVKPSRPCRRHDRVHVPGAVALSCTVPYRSQDHETAQPSAVCAGLHPGSARHADTAPAN